MFYVRVKNTEAAHAPSCASWRRFWQGCVERYSDKYFKFKCEIKIQLTKHVALLLDNDLSTFIEEHSSMKSHTKQVLEFEILGTQISQFSHNLLHSFY